jgi:hypothetical protein
VLSGISEEVVMNSEGWHQIWTRNEHPRVTPPAVNLLHSFLSSQTSDNGIVLKFKI